MAPGFTNHTRTEPEVNGSKPAAEPQPSPLPDLAAVPCDDCDKYKDDDALSDPCTETRRTLTTCSQDVVNFTHQTNTSNTDKDGDADATLVGSDPVDPNDLPPVFGPQPKATETSIRFKRKWEANIGRSPGNVAQKHKHPKAIDLSRDEEVSTESSVSFSRLTYALRSLEGQSWVNDEALRSILGRLNSDDCLVTDSCSLGSASSKQKRLARAKSRTVVSTFINGKHWVLYSWHRDAPAIEYMDPFNKPPEKDVTEGVLRLLQKLTELDQLLDVVPRETNSFDCGIITMINAFSVATRLSTLPFTSTPFSSVKSRFYFRQMFLTSPESMPLDFAARVWSLSALNAMKRLRRLASAADRIPKYVGRIQKQDLYLRAHLSILATQLQQGHDKHYKKFQESHLRAQETLEFKTGVKRRIDRLEKAIALAGFGNGGRELGPWCWPDNRPLTVSILMLRHMGRRYAAVEEKYQRFLQCLKAID
ncbi:Putative papain-like cysteine peptidase superfamily [Colletotrichum destructivum]|uniref:Papain-like cysteine peptidase superfamily n=1 Tax=Colletotrichum destructivum TaxID=34406 RepID=A0AAX4IXX2_9PEZI|nr:Putative papain-like cysteine peptidase superfamily [Colletotrichum destructivum]